MIPFSGGGYNTEEGGEGIEDFGMRIAEFGFWNADFGFRICYTFLVSWPKTCNQQNATWVV